MVPVVFLVVLFVGAVLFLLGTVAVVLLVRSNSGAAKVAGFSLLAVGLVLPVLMVMFFTVRSVSIERNVATTAGAQAFDSDQPTSVATPSIPAPPVATAPPSVPTSSSPPRSPSNFDVVPASDSTAWSTEVDQGFVADVYPSVPAATQALVRMAVAEIQQASDLSADTEGADLVVHWVDQIPVDKEGGLSLREADPASLQQLASEVLRDAFPSCQLVSADSSEIGETTEDAVDVARDVVDKPEGETDLELPSQRASVSLQLSLLHLKRSRSNWDASGSQASGKLLMVVKSADSASRHTVDFSEKPWVDSPQDFASGMPGNRHWLVAKSPRFASSAKEARQEATAAASSQWRSRSGGEAVSRAMADGTIVADRFTQRLTRPYGYVWREAILYDVTPAKLAEVQRQAQTEQARTLSTFAGRVLAFLALAIMATVVYLILNAVTRGYYRGTVMGVVGALIAVVVLVVLLFAGWKVEKRESPLSPSTTVTSRGVMR